MTSISSSITKCVVSVFFVLSLCRCSGDECAASADFINDIDSDCVSDTSDNCVGVYNPDQFDGDEDSVGALCDTDDTSDTTSGVDLIKEEALNLFAHYPLQEVDEDMVSLTYSLYETNCPNAAEVMTIPAEIMAHVYVEFTHNDFFCSGIWVNEVQALYCVHKRGACFAYYEVE